MELGNINTQTDSESSRPQQIRVNYADKQTAKSQQYVFLVYGKKR